jgi:hypothetical protein
MNTNKQRQREYKARMREAGYAQVTVWVPVGRKAEIARVAEDMRVSNREREHKMNVKHISTECNATNITDWYSLTGTDKGTGWEFDSETFGVVFSGEDTVILDCDGCPCTEGDRQTEAVWNALSYLIWE